MGIGAIVGGALKGYGDGMAEMARSREEERRETALINIRSQRQQEQTQVTADLQDRNSSRQAVYDNWKDSEHVKRTTVGQIQVDKARTENDMTLEQMRQKNTEALARLQSSLRMNEAQKESAIRMQEEAIKANTYIQDFQTDDQGNLVGITATGKTIRPGVRPMPKQTAGDSRDPIAAARNRASAGAQATNAGPSPSKNVASPQNGNTYTRADLEFTAQQRGMSTAEVEKQLRAAGYTMVNQ